MESRIGIGVSGDPLNGITMVIDNLIIGRVIKGLAISTGITGTSDRVVIKGNTIRNHSHGIRTAGDNSVIQGNSIYDTTNAEPSAPFAIRILSGIETLIADNYVANPISTTMLHAISIDAGATDTKVMNNDLADSTGTLINDAGVDS